MTVAHPRLLPARPAAPRSRPAEAGPRERRRQQGAAAAGGPSKAEEQHSLSARRQPDYAFMLPARPATRSMDRLRSDGFPTNDPRWPHRSPAPSPPAALGEAAGAATPAECGRSARVKECPIDRLARKGRVDAEAGGGEVRTNRFTSLLVVQ